MTRTLVIGSGAREHALVDLFARSGAEVHAVPGNAGIERIAECHPAEPLTACEKLHPLLIVIGPEEALFRGEADRLRAAGFPVLGPGKVAAALESSKSFGKEIARAAGIPLAPQASPENFPFFAKYDGPAAGKGTFYISGESALRRACEFCEAPGRTGNFLLEKPLIGEEFSSFLLFWKGEMKILGHAKDHKTLTADTRSLMTGGMGAIAPHPVLPEKQLDGIAEDWGRKTIAVLRERGVDYEGFLFLGGIMTAEGPFLLEYNCRFGDPEAQAILPAFILDDPADPLSLKRTDRISRRAVCVTSEGYPERKTPVAISAEELSHFEKAVPLFFGASHREKEHIRFDGGRILTSVVSDSVSRAALQEFLGRHEGLRIRADIFS